MALLVRPMTGNRALKIITLPQRSYQISPWFYEILKGYNPRLFTSDPYPHVPYYIYNQVEASQAPREGNQTDYQDGPFVSIYFGSVAIITSTK